MRQDKPRWSSLEKRFRTLRMIRKHALAPVDPRPVRLSAHTVGPILQAVHKPLFKHLVAAIIDGRLIVNEWGPIINSVTDPERRQELVKAICLRNIRQGDSN